MVIAQFTTTNGRWFYYGQMWSRDYTGRLCWLNLDGRSHYWPSAK